MIVIFIYDPLLLRLGEGLTHAVLALRSGLAGGGGHGFGGDARGSRGRKPVRLRLHDRPAAQGAKEIEQWMTWRHQKIGGYYDQVEGRTEVEYGLTDRLQVALYGNYAWARRITTVRTARPRRPSSSPTRTSTPMRAGATSVSSASPLKPSTACSALHRWRGPGVLCRADDRSAVQGTGNEGHLQKNFLDDRLTTAFNFTYAPEWRYLADDAAASGKSWQEETDINFNFAVSYRFAPNWSAGVEFVNEREYNSTSAPQCGHVCSCG